ncbi:hypothetical protein CcCBS67573_g08634 [Chytriomyces confervae]|uniref:Uncharacterized protein n=1 Tax=Chytriomyces confervae TaxID=246404 RepID=A0A507EK61_9FUNG|nr:hypothetical protein CcCBS67573_g08634 [Chytriomyces confervae]
MDSAAMKLLLRAFNRQNAFAAIVFLNIIGGIIVVYHLSKQSNPAPKLHSIQAQILASKPAGHHTDLSFLRGGFSAKPVLLDSTAGASETAWTRTLTCPRWEAYDKRIQEDKDFSGSCKQIGSQNGFNTTMCMSQRFCGQGYILVERLDKELCDAAFNQTVSADAGFDQYVKERVGPDSFYLVFNGNERNAPATWTHIARCTYKIPFRLTNPGSYSVQLFHTHENFAPINEVQPVWPKAFLNNLVANEYTMDVCLPIFTPKTVRNMNLPLCSRSDPQQGVYLKMTFETERETMRHAIHQMPFICDRVNFNIGVYGDSHSRTLWNGIHSRLSANKKPLGIFKLTEGGYRMYNPADMKSKLNLTDEEIQTHQSGRIDMSNPINKDPFNETIAHLDVKYKGLTHINIFTDASYFQKWDSSFGKSGASLTDITLFPHDAVIINVGQWAASGPGLGGHFSTKRYTDLLRYAANEIELVQQRRPSLPAKPLDFIWLGITAFPVIADPNHFRVGERDWRTNHRLRIWSEYSEGLFRDMDIKSMNAFDISHPWILESRDKAHFYDLPAMDALVDEALHKLNICAY